MTDQEIRLEVLKILVPCASKHGIEKAQVLEVAPSFEAYVKGQDNSKKSPGK